MPLTDAEELELLQLEEAEHQASEKPAAVPPEKSWGDTIADYGASAIPLATGFGGAATGTLLGGPAGGIAGGAAGYAGGRQLEKSVRENYLNQKQDPTTLGEVGTDLGIGALSEVGGQLLAKPLSKVGQFISKRLGGFAERTAENATGATRAQAEKFVRQGDCKIRIYAGRSCKKSRVRDDWRGGYFR